MKVLGFDYQENQWILYEVYFLAPDKSGFVGFKLGGYDFTPEGDTNMTLLFNND